MADKNIRGITIEIGGDTTKLGKALDGVNKKTKDLQTELRGVESLLKMDPGNVTLLKQKQDLLNESISNTKSKLDTLKEAQKQVQEQFDKGEITEEQFRNFQREIVATEQKLEGLTDQMKEFGSVGAQKIALAGEKVQEFGSKVESAGKKMSIVSAGIVGIGTASVGAFYELDEGYDTIITKTGATGDALESLNQSANNVFGSMPTDMESVGIAIGEVNTRFGYTGTQLEELSTQFLQFSQINGVDLNNSIGTVDKILEQFNMTGEDAGGVLDLITQKAQETGIGADKLMNLIQENGTTFKDMGIGVNEAVVLLSQFEANGVNVETALKGLKKSTVEYAKEGLTMEEGLAKTIDSIKNAKTETEALAQVEKIFGSKGANEMVKAIREGRINIDDLSASMESYSGTVENTFNATLDPVDDVKVGFNNLKLVGAELGDKIQTALLPIINGLVSALKKLNTWFSNLSPTAKTMVVVIGGLVASIGPLLLIAGKLITSFGTIMTTAPKLVSAFKGVGTAFKALGSAFTANPIGIIITAITALVATFIYLWNNCEAFREFWINLWNKILEVVGPVFESIKTWFEGLWAKIQEIWAFIEPYISTAIEFLSGLVSTVINEVVEMFTLAWEAIKAIWNFVKPYFEAIWSAIKAIFSVVVDVIGGFFSKAWDAIKLVWDLVQPYFSTVWENIKAVFSVVVEVLGGFFSSAWEVIKTVWSVVVEYFKTIWENVKLIFSVVKDVFSGNFKGAWESIKKIFGNFVGFFSTLWDSVKKIFSVVGSFFSTVFKAGFDGIKKVFNGIDNFFNGIWARIKKIFSKVGETIGGAVSNAFSSAINWVLEKAIGIINGFIKAINLAIGVINAIPGVNISKLSLLDAPKLYRGGVLKKGQVGLLEGDGAEAVVPLEKETGWINRIAQKMNALQNADAGNGALSSKMDELIRTMKSLKQTIVLDTGTLVGETVNQIDQALGNTYALRERRI